jgi:hypothetical protein
MVAVSELYVMAVNELLRALGFVIVAEEVYSVFYVAVRAQNVGAVILHHPSLARGSNDALKYSSGLSGARPSNRPPMRQTHNAAGLNSA